MTAPTPFDRDLARQIDHTLLRPDATVGEIERLCAEARAHGFASVCVNSCHVPLAVRLLEGTEVRVCATIGFPLGGASSEAKVAETERATADGAREVDMVMNIGWLKSGLDREVENDIRLVAQSAHRTGAICKVILETGLLDREEKLRACALASQAGADYVKTSTGFGHGGATTDDIRLMRQAVGGRIGVKASGGIRTRQDALAMLAAGASRIGASASVAIVSNTPPNR
jgi:deoxyribose-phosphate aldolase